MAEPSDTGFSDRRHEASNRQKDTWLVSDRYHIETLVGTGSWSKVYRARDLTLRRIVALKFLQEQHLADSSMVERFRQEAESAARLSHQNIATVYDHGFDRAPYIVMEYVEGPTLEQLLDEKGAIPWHLAAALFLQICAGLEAAHKKGIVHRDIKPGNIIVTKQTDASPAIKIVDFGLAKIFDEQARNSLTSTGHTIGTPSYMSPEQCLGKSIDERSDIYSLGCVMYEVLTGSCPFRGDGVMEVMLQHINELPATIESPKPSPDLSLQALLRRVGGRSPSQKANTAESADIPTTLESVVLRTLNKDPNDRYAFVADLAKDLNFIMLGKIFSISNYDRYPIIKRRLAAWLIDGFILSAISISTYLVFLQFRILLGFIQVSHSTSAEVLSGLMFILSMIWLITLFDALLVSILPYVVLWSLIEVSKPMTVPQVTLLATLVAALCWNWLYHAILESSPIRGTVGKHLMGLNVACVNGDKLSFGKATLRHFSKMLSPVAFLLRTVSDTIPQAGLTKDEYRHRAYMIVRRLLMRPFHDWLCASIVTRKDSYWTTKQ